MWRIDVAQTRCFPYQLESTALQRRKRVGNVYMCTCVSSGDVFGGGINGKLWEREYEGMGRGCYARVLVRRDGVGDRLVGKWQDGLD